MPTSDITALVKGQLADTREWNVQKFSIGAEPDSLPSLQLGTNASMSKLYTGDVEMAKKLIDKIENGDVFNVDEYYEAEVKNIPNYNSFYKLNGISSNNSSNTTKTTSAVKETQPATTRRSVKTTAATEEEITTPKATEPATVKPTVATEATAAPTQKTTEATAVTTTAAAAEAPKAEAGNISDVERTAP